VAAARADAVAQFVRADRKVEHGAGAQMSGVPVLRALALHEKEDNRRGREGTDALITGKVIDPRQFLIEQR